MLKYFFSNKLLSGKTIRVLSTAIIAAVILGCALLAWAQNQSAQNRQSEIEKIRILPSAIYLEDDGWQNPNPVLSQDLNADSGLADFNQTNSVYFKDSGDPSLLEQTLPQAAATENANADTNATGTEPEIKDKTQNPAESEIEGSGEQIDQLENKTPTKDVPENEPAENIAPAPETQEVSPETEKESLLRIISGKTMCVINDEPATGTIPFETKNSEGAKEKTKETADKTLESGIAAEIENENQENSITTQTEQGNETEAKQERIEKDNGENDLPAETKKILVTREAYQKSIEFSRFDADDTLAGAKIENIQLRFSIAGTAPQLPGVEPNELAIEYSLAGSPWSDLQMIVLDKEISNNLNNGFFLAAMPEIKSLADLNDLKIRFTYRDYTPGREQTTWLDAVWLDAEFSRKTNNYGTRNFTREKPVLTLPITEDDGFWENIWRFVTLKKDKKISFEIKKPRGVAEDTAFERQGNNIVITEGEKKAFRPGKYTFIEAIDDNGAVSTTTQDFSLGVLAINTDKAAYNPGEEAYLQMGAVNEWGHTVCDANLKLEITAPGGQTSEIAVATSSECGINNYTLTPDYSARYQTREAGFYTMKLTNLDNGDSITDTFEVNDSLAFEIHRTGPSRINPSYQYQMVLDIIANENYHGKIIETLPAGFTAESEGMEMTQSGDSVQLSWDADLKAGDTRQIIYAFNAPMVSPYRYFLGPLQIGEFIENREWQIASDAPIASVSGGGNWNSTATWTGGVIPGSGDAVTITCTSSGPTVTVDINTAAAASLKICGSSANGNSGTLAFNNGSVLTVGGAVTIGVDSKSTGNIDMTSGGTLKIGDAVTISKAGTWTRGSGTVEFNGTAQTVGDSAFFTNFNNLVLSNSGAKTLSTGLANVYGNLTLSGTATTATTVALTIGGNLSIGDGTTFTAGAYNLTVTGTTTVGGGSSGTLAHSSTTGTKIFAGLVTINSGASWTNSVNEAVTFRGGITNSSTSFSPGTAVQTFDTTANQTITCNSTTTIPNMTVTGVTVTHACSETYPLIVSTALADGGSGIIKAGTNSYLKITAASPNTSGFWDNTTNGTSTVDFNGSGTQTIPGATYHHLKYTGSSTGTLGGAITANGDMTINSGGTVNTSAANNYAVTWNGSFTKNGTFTANASPITIGGTSATPSIAAFTTTGACSFTRTSSTATLTGNMTCASLTMNGSGGTLNLGTSLTHTFSGNITMTAGTLNGGSSTLKTAGALSGTGATFTAATSTVEFNGSSEQTIPAYNFYNITSSSSGGRTLASTGAIGIAGTFTPGSNSYTITDSTVDYNGAAQNVATTTYNNLTLSNSGTKTCAAAITVNANLSLSGAAQMALASATNSTADKLYFSSTEQTPGTWGSTLADKTYKNDTWFASSTGYLTVANGIIPATAPSFTVAPHETPTSDGTAPTDEGDNVTFTASSTDANGDDWYLAVCKTNEIATTSYGAPTCPGGEWAISEAASSSVGIEITYQATTTDAESNAWYAFACDKTNDSPKCSEKSNSGTEGDNGSPFAVNHRPVFDAVLNNGPADPGGSVTITASTTDLNGNDLSLFVCKSNDFANGACGAGGTWCSATSSSVDDGYLYRKSISITGQSGAGANYQVKLLIGETSGASGENFDLGGHALDFPNDIKFTDNDGSANLDFWVESTSGTTPNRLATVWVEVADNLDSNQSIYIYYGKSGQSSLSNGSATFIHFDDFETNDFSRWDSAGSGWSIQGTTVAEGSYSARGAYAVDPNRLLIKDISANRSVLFHVRTRAQSVSWAFNPIFATTAANKSLYLCGMNGGYFRYVPASSWTNLPTLTSYNLNTWYTCETAVDNANQLYRWWVNGVSKGTAQLLSGNVLIATNDYVKYARAYGDNNSGGVAFIDQYWVRAFTATEPAYSSAGSEEPSNFYPLSCTVDIPNPQAHGNINYYPYVIDSHNLEASGGEHGQLNTFTVNDVLPEISGSVYLNGGAAIDLTNESSITNIYATGIISDANGCSDITASTTADVWLTSLGHDGCDAAGEADGNNCYPRLNCAYDIATDECTGSDDPTAGYKCTVPFEYYANPTDSNTPWSDQGWKATLIPADGQGENATSSADSASTTLNSFLALGLADDYDAIAYGTLATNAYTDPLLEKTRVEATGNCSLNVNLSGTAMTGPGTAIPIANQRYGAGDTAPSWASVAGNTLSGTPTPFALGVCKSGYTAAPTQSGVSIDSGTGEFSGYAWGENIGWVSFNCSNTDSCGQVNYKVKTVAGAIDGTDRYAWMENAGWLDFGTSEGNVSVGSSELSGYAWGENIGWVSLNCSNTDSCAANDYKIANDGNGNLSGHAWGENIGWIDFAPHVSMAPAYKKLWWGIEIPGGQAMGDYTGANTITAVKNSWTNPNDWCEAP